MCGDTNCDFKDPKNKNTKLLKQLYNEYQLEQLIKDYTRVAVRITKENEHHTSKTLIDHFSTNKPKYILSSGVIKSGMVDHYMIYVIRKVNAWRIRSKKSRILETRSLRNYDKAKLLHDLKEVNWEQVLSPFSESPNLMVDKFHNIFDELLNLHAPIRRKKIRNQLAPWITPQIKRLMEERDRAKKNSVKNPKLLKSYKSLQNKVTNTIRSSMRLHYQSLINENKDNPKNMWRTINKVLDKAPNSSTITQIRDGSKTVSDSKQIANALNSHFVNVGPRLASRIEVKSGDDPLCHFQNRTEETVFQFKHINESTVLEYIQNLKQGKSAGPDKIPTTILKDAADFICKPLTMIFNSSSRLGTFPDR